MLLITTLFFLLLSVGFCQGRRIRNDDEAFIKEPPIPVKFLRGIHTFGIIHESSKQIHRQILESAIGDNKTQLVFTVLGGNCGAPHYKEIQEGVINILKSKFVGLRISVNTTSNERYTCYENMNAEW